MIVFQTPDTSEDTSPSQEGIPPGYEAISLIEALNGPATPTTTHGTNTQQRTSYPDGMHNAINIEKSETWHQDFYMLFKLQYFCN